MPHVPLPESLVNRFKRVAHRLKLWRMKNLDYRVATQSDPTDRQRGGRVREIKIRPETSMIPVAIKRVHGRLPHHD